MDGPAPLVIVIDDDAAVRDALDGLLRSVDLEGRLHGSVRQFLDLIGHPALFGNGDDGRFAFALRDVARADEMKTQPGAPLGKPFWTDPRSLC